MTDRPIRPLFPKGFRREIQIVLTTLSSDRENPSDIFGTIGASTALGISAIPFEGPVSSVRVARIDGQLKAMPTYEELEVSDLDLIVAGTEDSIVMIEAGANQVPEAEIIAAIEYARGPIAQLNALQREVVDAIGLEKTAFREARDRRVAPRPCARRPTGVATRRCSTPSRATASAASTRSASPSGNASAARATIRSTGAPSATSPRTSSRSSSATASSARACVPTTAPSRTSARSSAASACSRARTAPGSSAAAGRRCSRSPRSARSPTASGSTRSRRRSSSATCTTTTSRRTRWARRAPCAAPAAARSATACSPSARCCPCSRTPRSSRTRSASSPTH